jgi:hypothetical protein
MTMEKPIDRLALFPKHGGRVGDGRAQHLNWLHSIIVPFEKSDALNVPQEDQKFHNLITERSENF